MFHAMRLAAVTLTDFKGIDVTLRWESVNALFGPTAASTTESSEDRRSDAVLIWNHSLLEMRCKRIGVLAPATRSNGASKSSKAVVAMSVATSAPYPDGPTQLRPFRSDA